MKHTPIFLAALLTLSACGTKSEQTTEPSTTDTETTSGPMAITGGSRSQEVNGYQVSITCLADSSTVVKDQLDQEFYDNKVEVIINKEGAELFRHTFSKSEFSGNYDAAHSILQGMAFSDIQNGLFVFGAQVGEPGNDEGGSNYRITVSTAGSMNIAPDYTQDTSSNGAQD